MDKITPQQWMDRGYLKYNQDSLNHSDYLLQKRVDDEFGKKYYITVYVYDNLKMMQTYPSFPKFLTDHTYMVECNFELGNDGPTVNPRITNFSTIDEVEELCEKFWVMLDKPYYEKW